MLLPALLATVALLATACSGRDEPELTADLAGDWRYAMLLGETAPPPAGTGAAAGFVFGTARFGSDGTLTDLGGESAGGTYPGGAVRRWTLDESGTARSADPYYPDLHGQLGGAKDLLVATATHDASGARRPSMRVYQKVAPGLTYSLADVAGKTFLVHGLRAGAGAAWVHGTASVTLDGVLSFGEWVSSAAAPDPVPNAGTVVVSPNGTVTLSSLPSFRGMLSADKSLLVGVDAPQPGAARLLVLTLPAAGAAVADLEGAWRYHSLATTGAGSRWIHGDVAYVGGAASFANVLDARGATTPPLTYTAQVAADGTLTAPENAVRHGALAVGKDLVVFTGASQNDSAPFLTLTVR